MRGAIRIGLALAGFVAVILGVIYFTIPAGSLLLPEAFGQQNRL